MKTIYWSVIYLLVGIWSVIAPYALNIPENSDAFRNSLAVGAVLILVSLVEIFSSQPTGSSHFQKDSPGQTAR